jgi:Spy/CpxP family protein refolding chaperone
MGVIENALKKSEAARTALRESGVKTFRAVSAVLTAQQREKWRSRTQMYLAAKGEERNLPGPHRGGGEPDYRR